MNERVALSIKIRTKVYLWCVTLLVSHLGPALAQRPKSVEQVIMIPVIVRDLRGQPIAGLNASQFTIRDESGPLPVGRVLQANNLRGAPGDTHVDTTIVLLIIPPMRPESLHFTVKSARRSLPKLTSCCVVKVLGPHVETPFTHDRTILEQAISSIEHAHIGQHDQERDWTQNARAVISSLSGREGRHVILFANATNTSGTTDRYMMPRMSPLGIVGGAIESSASVYSVQVDGPQPIVPFGNAADAQIDGQGSDMLVNLQNNLNATGQMQAEALAVAEITGGTPVGGFSEAADALTHDNQGFYELLFNVPADHMDGSWRHVSVSSNVPNTRVWSGRFYSSPNTAEVTLAVPQMLRDAIDKPLDVSTPIVIREWFFPDGIRTSSYTLPFSIHIESPRKERAKNVEAYIRLINLNLGLQVGSWYVGPSKTSEGVLERQFEATLGPGDFLIDVIAHDTSSQAVNHKQSIFVVHSVANQLFAVSSVVLSERCLPGYQPQIRRRLDDPINLDGCTIVLSPQAQFRSNTTLHVLMRIYSHTPAQEKDMVLKWKAQIKIDGKLTGGSIPLVSEIPRGLLVSSLLPVASNRIESGVHRLQVFLQSPNKNVQVGEKQSSRS